jgi:tetratricopeptide (TPR) repeat protein
MSETHPTPQSKSTPRTYSTWFGFATRELTARGTVRIHILWGRVALLILAMGMFAWAGKSFALYYFFKNIRGFEDVAFVDMIAFPLNRTNVRIQQGDYQIDTAKEALEREDYRRAYALLREGVARSPANLEGRMLLAQIYAGWRPDLATELLVSGAEYGVEDPEYIKLMSMLLINQKQDQQVLDVTEALLEENPGDEVRQILNVARLQSAMFLGRYDIARTIFDETNLKQTLDGVILGTKLYMQVGKEETATDVLLSVINSMQAEEITPVYNQLVSVYKNQGIYDKAREAAIEMVIRNPMEWRPRIVLIDILSASEQVDRRDREIEALLQQHRNDEQAMTALAQLCAEYGNVRAASRLYEIALENGYTLSLFSLTLAEAYVNAGDTAKAIELCNELVREDPSWLLNAESSFNAIRSLAYFNHGDTELGRLYLKNFLESRRTNVNQLYQAARSFRKFGMDQEALVILEDAYSRDADNEIILAALIDVEMNLGVYFSIDEHLETLFGLRRPDYALIESIHQRLQSDRFLFTEDRVALLTQLEAILKERETVDWDIWERRDPEASTES